MQIMIDIPDRLLDNEFGYTDIRLHKDIKHINSITTQDYEYPFFADLSFVVLPEHHGRLIDADAYREAWFNSRQFEPMLLLDFAPTVIEADKE